MADLSRRRLSLPIFASVLVPYVAMLVVVPFLVKGDDSDATYAEFVDVEAVVRGLVVPVGLSLLFVLLAVTLLGQWNVIIREERKSARWVRIVPLMLVAAIIIGTNYSGLADLGVEFTAVLLVGALFVGFAEELMFRGLAIAALRERDLSEGRVALWSSMLFGATHAVNIFVAGPSALVQVFVTAIAGYFFYLTRRWSGGILVPAVLHGLWDFGLFSGRTDADEVYVGAIVFIVVDILLAVLVLRRRNRVEA